MDDGLNDRGPGSLGRLVGLIRLSVDRNGWRGDCCTPRVDANDIVA